MVLGLMRTPSTGSLSNLGDSLRRSNSTGSLTKALKRFSTGDISGLGSAGFTGMKHATDDADVMEEEAGDWKYMVIDPKGIRARQDANYAKESKATTKYPEGAIVEVDRRRRSGWTTFLRLSDGWLFDVSPKDKKVRMIEVEVAIGQWSYEACGFERVPILAQPTTSSKKAMKGTSTLEIREVVMVTKRVRPVSGKGSFLKLADGRGWVLDFADGHRTLQRWTPPGGEIDYSEPSSCSSAVVGASAEDNLGPPEFGEWEYVVLDQRGMSLRSKPTYDPEHKIDRRIHEGEVVVVNERRAGDGTTFLKVACPQGWAFDRQPGKDSRVRMIETTVEKGDWHYLVTAASGIALRARCSFSDTTKCGQGPLKGALLEIVQRVRVGETTFLQLKDGGRWVFDTKSGRKVVDGPLPVQVPPAGTLATIRASDGVHLLQSPTNQKWAMGKLRLLENAQVEVSKIIAIEGSRWAFVSKPGSSNMEGWIHMDNVSLQDVCLATSDAQRRPSSACQKTFRKEQCQAAWNAPFGNAVN